MKFKILAEYLLDLEKTSSRIEITKILAALLKKTTVDEIDKVTYLILGYLAPSYMGIVFNLAERTMIGVLAKAYGVEKNKVRELYKKVGDIGNAASELALNLKLKTKDLKLSVADVYEKLLDIARDEGEKSVERKIQAMAKCLRFCSCQHKKT